MPTNAMRPLSLVYSIAAAADASVLLGASPYNISSLVTDEFPLLDIHTAFSTAEDRIGGAIKVVVKP